MSDYSPIASFDHPILQPSTAAREAAHEDVVPHTPPSVPGKSYFRLATIRPGAFRRTSSFSSSAGDAESVRPNGSPADADKNGSRPRALSYDLRSGNAVPMMPETPAK